MKSILLIIIMVISLIYCQDLQWTETYHNDMDPTGWDIGWKVFETDDGGFLIIGETDWPELVDSISYRWHDQFFIIKTDEFGNAISKRMYCDTVWGVKDVVKFAEDTILAFGEFGFDGHHRILGVNQDGDSIFCGVLDSMELYGVATALTNDRCLVIASNDEVIFLVKLRIDGEILWFRRYGEGCPRVVLQTQDSGFIIGGGTGSFQGWVMKVDSTGDSLWKVFPLPHSTAINSIVETAPNEFLCLGLSGYCWLFVCKIIGDGEILWEQHWMYDYADTSYAQAYSLIPTFDGNFVFCGQTGGHTWYDSAFDGFLVKIDSLGNVIWQRRVDVYGRPDIFYSVIQTLDSGYVCTGYSSLCTDPDSCECETLEVCLVKFSKDGDIIWENGLKIPEKFSLSISPNPFNSSCVITANVGEGLAPAKIEIYDLNGKCIWAFDKTPCVWQPAQSISSGIYLIRATKGGETITKRAVLLK